MLSRISFAQEKCELWVSEGFQKPIINKNVEINNSCVMDILTSNVVVKATYAGGFVNSINGIASEFQKDWFYYVNGILAHKGALEYFPQDGDIIWWDFHSWSDAMYIPSVIGSFPQPFLSGYYGRRPPTAILCAESLIKEAEQFKEILEALGIKEIDLNILSGDFSDCEKKYTILIGSWDDLIKYKFIKDIYENSKKVGFFVKFENDAVKALDIYGREAKSFESAGVIISVKFGINDANPIWFITGSDDTATNKALEVLIKDPDKIKFHAAAIISENKIYNAPQ